MTPDQFKMNAISILNSPVGWQTRIARILDVKPNTVRKWLTSGIVPDWVEDEFARLTGKSEISPWPRDEWVIGTTFNEQGKAREYIYHAAYPRFIARIIDMVDDQNPRKEEHPVDLESGVIYGVDQNTCLAEISFIDPLDVPTMRQWLEAAGDEIERVSAIKDAIARHGGLL